MKKIILFSFFLTISLQGISQKLRFNNALNKFCETSVKQFDSISPDRKEILNKIAESVKNKKNVIFTCFTNSRRTQLLQTWMQTSFFYYGIFEKTAYSYGDSVTEIAKPAVNALKKSGFILSQSNTKPKVWVFYISESFSTYAIYPKATNQITDSSGIIINICEEGEKNSINSTGNSISLPYPSPIKFENTPDEKSKYANLNRQIAIEMLYLADKVATKLYGR